MSLMRFNLFLASLTALSGIAHPAMSKALNTPMGPDLWYAPCKDGATVCENSERIWSPYEDYELAWLGNDRSRIYLSKPPYKVLNGFRSVWVYEDNKMKKFSGSNVTYLYLADCTKWAIQVIQQRTEGASQNPTGASDWEYASPATFNNMLLKQVCKSPPIGPTKAAPVNPPRKR